MASITVLDSGWERFYGKGRRCLADRDYRGAITEFTKVVNGLPHHRGAHYLLAESLLRFGRVEEAIAALQTMRRLFPADPRVALALGRLLMKTDRKAEGIEALERSLALTHDEATQHADAAVRCRAEGDVSRALSELQEGCLGFERAAKLRLTLVNFFFNEKRVDDAFRVAQVEETPISGAPRSRTQHHG